MSDLVVISDVALLRSAAGLKQAALLFDRILVPDLEIFLDAGVVPQEVPEIEWLRDNGVVATLGDVARHFPDPPEGDISEYGVATKEFRTLAEDLQQRVDSVRPGQQIPSEQAHSLIDDIRRLFHLHARNWAIHQRLSGGSDAAILSSDLAHAHATFPSGRDSVAHVVLKEIPMPDDVTPWEAILDFREDPDARAALERLRRWMASVPTLSTSLRAVEAEVQALIADYTEIMRIHRMKYQLGALQTLVLAGAGFAENMAKLRFEKAISALFALRERRIALLEAERTALGRPLSYVLMTRAAFGAER